MEQVGNTRNLPLSVGLGLLFIVSLAVARLPESFVDQMRRNRPFDISQSGWLYRLLAIVAFAQAAYIGFVLLRTDRVQRARERDSRLARMTKREVMASIAWNAVGMALLTLVYGLSAFALTGERGGYWLFAFLCLLQLAWYFRQVGEIDRWIAFQPEFAAESGAGESRIPEDRLEPVHYVPPLARGVSAVHDEEG